MKKKSKTVQVGIDLEPLDEALADRLHKKYYRTVHYTVPAAWGPMKMTEQRFIPREFNSLKKARESAREFASAFGNSSLLIRKPNKKYTFVPVGGDFRTAVNRTARALGAKLVDEVVCFTI